MNGLKELSAKLAEFPSRLRKTGEKAAVALVSDLYEAAVRTSPARSGKRGGRLRASIRPWVGRPIFQAPSGAGPFPAPGRWRVASLRLPIGTPGGISAAAGAQFIWPGRRRAGGRQVGSPNLPRGIHTALDAVAKRAPGHIERAFQREMRR